MRFLFESALKLTSRLASTLFIVLLHLPRTQSKHSLEKDLGALLRPGSSKELHSSKLCERVKRSRANIYLRVHLCSLYLYMYLSMYVSMYKCICVCMYQPIYLSSHPSIHVINAKKNTLLSSNLRVSLTNNKSHLQLFVILDPSCLFLQLLAAGDLNMCANMPPLR